MNTGRGVETMPRPPGNDVRVGKAEVYPYRGTYKARVGRTGAKAITARLGYGENPE